MQTLQPDLSGALYETKWNKKAGTEGGTVCPNNNLQIFSRVEIVVFDDDADELSLCHFRGIDF